MKLLVSTTYRAARLWLSARDLNPRDYVIVTVSSPHAMMGYRFREEDVSFTGEWELENMSRLDRQRWHDLRYQALARASLSR